MSYRHLEFNYLKHLRPGTIFNNFFLAVYKAYMAMQYTYILILSLKTSYKQFPNNDKRRHIQQQNYSLRHVKCGATG